MLDFLFGQFEGHGQRTALIWQDREYSYHCLLEGVRRWQSTIRQQGLAPGTVVALEAEFSPNSVALFLALVDHACIIVPLTDSVGPQRASFLEIAQVETSVVVNNCDTVEFRDYSRKAEHPFYGQLRNSCHPGLVLFSSGSTGKPKAALHDLVRILEKFRTPRHCYRAIAFLLFDHIGGINTMLYQLSNGGCIVSVRDRRPDTVLEAIARHRVQMLPASPTFLNLILLSGVHNQNDVSSLELITYGTEPMPETVLHRLHAAFPNVRLQQTYGLSELGILRSKSRSSDSLWVKIGGEGFETRIVDGVLQIRADSAMLGYLNAPSPFTEDGWYSTGDIVEQDGDYVRFLGRVSEVINVGGEKVFPAEVENVIQELDDVTEAVVTSEPSAFVGNVVVAEVSLREDCDPGVALRKIKAHCRSRLPRFKVPVRVQIAQKPQHSRRFKKHRAIQAASDQPSHSS